MRFGVPLVAGLDPVPLALLDRIAAQANAEFALRGEPREVDVVRIAAEPDAVTLWGGTKVRPDTLFRERPGLDVLVAIGPAEPHGVSGRDEEAALAFLRQARGDAQQTVATGEGVAWLLEGGFATGRRVVMNHLAPALRAEYDAVLPAHTDPARDGDLWTASDPPHFMLLLLDLLRELGGRELQERVELRMPWAGTMRRALERPARDDGDMDDDGLEATQDV